MASRTYPPLHTAPKRPYYIYAPDYRQTSAGIRVTHLICHLLNRCGQDAYLLFAKQTNPLWHTPLLTDILEQQHAEAGRPPIVVYPEVVRGNPANGQSVVRYLLNVPGLLGGDSEFPATDMIFAYGENLLPEGLGDDHILFLPPIDTSIFNNQANSFDHHRKGWLLYPGRYIDALQQYPELAAKCTIITSKWPATPEEMAELFQRSERVYCFSSTAIALEAMLCGCPAVILKSPFFDGVPIGGGEFGTHGLAFEDSDEAVAQAVAGLDIVSQTYARLQNRFWEQFDIFIAKTQAMPIQPRLLNDVSVEQGAATPAIAHSQMVRQWLRQRTPNDAQAELIIQRLEACQQALPRFDFILVPDGQPGAVEVTRQSLLEQGYPFIGIHLPGDADAETLNEVALNRCHGQWLCFVRAGTTFTTFGLALLALELLASANVRAFYTDEVVRHPSGDMETILRPDFNLDMLLSAPASMAYHWFYKRGVFLDAGGFDPACAGAIELALLLRLIEGTDGVDGLAHVSEPLCITDASRPVHNPQAQAVVAQHLNRRGYTRARVQKHLPGIHRIHYGHEHEPLVSIIVPIDGQAGQIQHCITSLMERTTYPRYEILVLDDGEADWATRVWLDSLASQQVGGISVLSGGGGMAIQRAVQHARGDYLLMLGSDTTVVHSDWLDALLNHAQRPEVGIVGGKLLHPGGTVEQAGIVLGLNGAASTAFSGQCDGLGYMRRLEMDQNYSAVSAACLMIRRSLFEALGGLDVQQFNGSGAAIDLCLKSMQAGYLNVWTPHAVLFCEGRDASGQEAPTGDEGQAQQDALLRKWLPLIAHDPAYNRNLTLQGSGFTLETDPGLACRYLSWRPLPVVLTMPADFEASGHSRIIDPALAMRGSGQADIRLALRSYSPVELERLQPDAWVMQPPRLEMQVEALRQSAQFTSAFKVLEVDTLYCTEAGDSLSAPVDGALRRLSAMADRLLVATSGLAEALRDTCADVRVIPDRLNPARWSGLRSQRRSSARPRIGWVEAGGAQEQALLLEIVQQLHREVDWVCLGQCPSLLRPYLSEQHDAVSFDEYPVKLASLNLDLAIAPLAPGLFGECRSPSRLLEYAACGVPVVCSDVWSLQGLSVIPVGNISRDWVETIRMYLAEPEASARCGDALQEAVLTQWMLDEDHIQARLEAWLPG